MAGAVALAASAGEASAQTFTSTEDVTIPAGTCDQVTATPYGSQIEVSGVSGTVSSVSVSLDDLTTGQPVGVRLLLVGPAGHNVMLMHASGGYFTPVTDVSFSFADGGPIMGFSTPAEGGTYGPSGIQHQLCPNLFAFTSPFPAPAPGPTYGSALGGFGGSDPNGIWRLYVSSNTPGAAGDLSGWSVNITAEEPETACPDEPVGCWRFDEEAGTDLLDATGNGHDGTYLNGPLLGQPGAPGFDPNTAASFDGVNDLGRIPDAEGLDVGSFFTAEGWIRRSSDGKSHALFNKGNKGLHLVVMNAGAGNEIWLRKANVSTLARSSAGVPADDEYHHVVATMHGAGTARIYLDGADVTVPVPGQQEREIENTALPLFFGSGGSSEALYDEFALYDGALDSETIAGHYAAGAGGPVGDL